MIKLSQIIILNVPKREREGKYLKKLIEVSAKPFGIDVSISMDRGLGLWDNFSRALTQETKEGTHRMIVQDDISFERNILEKILYILQFAPEKSIISFYNPTNGDYTECHKQNKHVLSSLTNFWLQACVYPNDVARDFVETSNKMTDDQSRYDDSRLKAYLQSRGEYLYSIVPGFIQHLGAFRSNFGTSGSVGGILRYSSTYDSQLDVKSIDWAKEFANPFVAKSSKDWVREVVRKEFYEQYKKV